MLRSLTLTGAMVALLLFNVPAQSITNNTEPTLPARLIHSDGSPARGYDIQLINPQTREEQWTRTSRDGEFAVPIVPGNPALRRSPERSLASMGAGNLTPRLEGGTVVFELPYLLETFRGRAMSTRFLDQPLAQVEVELEQHSFTSGITGTRFDDRTELHQVMVPVQSQIHRAVTDDEGYFEMQRVRMDSEGPVGRVVVRRGGNTAWKTTRGLDAVLSEGTEGDVPVFGVPELLDFTGQLVDAETGEGVAHITFNLRHLNFNDEITSVTTDSQGFFRVPNVPCFQGNPHSSAPPRPYENVVYALSLGGTTRVWESSGGPEISVHSTVMEAESLTLTTISRPTFTVIALDLDGEPVEGVHVTLNQRTSMWSGDMLGTTDASGRLVTATPVRSDIYHLAGRLEPRTFFRSEPFVFDGVTEVTLTQISGERNQTVEEFRGLVRELEERIEAREALRTHTFPARLIYHDGSPAEGVEIIATLIGQPDVTLTTGSGGEFDMPLHHRDSVDSHRLRNNPLILTDGVLSGSGDSAEVIDGVIVYRLPHTSGTLHGIVVSALDRSKPLEHTEFVFRALRDEKMVHSSFSRGYWSVPSINLPALDQSIRMSSGEGGLFEVPDFPIQSDDRRELMTFLETIEPVEWPESIQRRVDFRNVASISRHTTHNPLTDSELEEIIRVYVLPEVTTLRGRVLHEQTEEPIANLDLEILITYNFPPIVATTDEHGVFTVERLALCNTSGNPRSHRIYITIAGSPLRWVSSNQTTDSLTVDQIRSGEATLVAKDSELLTVLAVDENDHPVPGARMRLAPIVDGQVPNNVGRTLGVTDEAGMITVAQPPEEGERILRGENPSERQILLSDPFIMGETPVIVARVIPKISLDLLFLDSHGQPLRESIVEVDIENTLQTDTPVDRRFHQWATDSQGIISLRERLCLPTTFVARSADQQYVKQEVDLTGARGRQRIILRLGDQERQMMRGQVHDISGAPLAGVEVMSGWESERISPTTNSTGAYITAGSESFTPLVSVFTDAQGMFEVPVGGSDPTMRSELYFRAEGYQTSAAEWPAGETRHVVLPPEIIFTGHLMGIDPNQVHNLWIEVDGSRANAHILADGSFRAPLMSGAAESSESPTAVARPQEFSITIAYDPQGVFAERTVTLTGEPEQEIDLGFIDVREESSPHEIRVRVVDTDGRPLPGASVEVLNRNWRTGGDGVTPAILLPTGDHEFTVQLVNHNEAEQKVEITEGGEITIRLEPEVE